MSQMRKIVIIKEVDYNCEKEKGDDMTDVLKLWPCPPRKGSIKTGPRRKKKKKKNRNKRKKTEKIYRGKTEGKEMDRQHEGTISFLYIYLYKRERKSEKKKKKRRSIIVYRNFGQLPVSILVRILFFPFSYFSVFIST